MAITNPLEDVGAALTARFAGNLARALDGLYAALAEAGLDAQRMLGARSLAELMAARPTAAELYAPTLFGSGLPLLGAYPAELAVMAADLAAGQRPEDVLDLRLS